jgi:ABC-type cobalamin/Fe3+-siderophores transport system ATPase subunit
MSEVTQRGLETVSAEVMTDSLSVRYPGGVLALDAVSLRIGQGLFGLLGPNGAGKTMLMRTLPTLQRPTHGSATVLGFDVEREVKSVRQLLGYLPQDFQTYAQLQTWQVLDKGHVRFVGQREELVRLAVGKVWRVTVDDREYESLRSQYSIASMIDTPAGLEVQLLSEENQIAKDDGWEAVSPTLEDA